MATVANQKIIIIGKETCENALYTKINLEALNSAMTNPRLTATELKFWLYLGKNKHEYNLKLSPSDAENWGISRASFYRAFKTLLNEGYLVPEHEGSNVFQFHEYPQTQKERKKKKWLHSDNYSF
ncbi:MAG: hypothetical protein IKE28_02240 [Solobacterium sp.]|nr:hypothetical protein [Solobacterium sp.]